MDVTAKRTIAVLIMMVLGLAPATLAEDAAPEKPKEHKVPMDCEMTYNLKGWSAIYKTAKGDGVITCTNGQTANVTISVHGGGITFGKTEIYDGKAKISGGRSIDDWMWRIRLAQSRHAHGQGCRFAKPCELSRVNGDRRYATFFQRRGQPDDRRATSASKTDAENRGIAISRDLRAHLRIVGPRLLGLDRADIDGRQMLVEPLAQLFDEYLRVVEQAVDEVNRLAVQHRKPRCQTLADDFRRIAAWIVHRDPLRHRVLSRSVRL